MELRNIRTFQRVVELGNFSRAAKDLGYTQSAVTIQIRNLEQELGVSLFERIGKRVRLTDQGHKFMGYAEKILNTEQEAINTMAGEEHISGELHIGSAESIESHILPDVLTQFAKQCPEVQTFVHTTDVMDMHNAIDQNRIDCLIYLEVPQYHSNRVRAVSVPRKFDFIAPKNHHLCNKKNVTLSEILSQPLALTERGLSYRAELDRIAIREGLNVDPMFEIDNTTLLINMVRNGNYISHLPDFVTRSYIEEGLVSKIDCNVPSELCLQMVYHKDKYVGPKLRILQECLTDVLENKI